MPGVDATFPRVIAQDVGVDAVLVGPPDDQTLVVRPHQSFSSAVAAVQRCLPGMHPDAVRRLVREQLPAIAPTVESIEDSLAAATPLPVAPRRSVPRWAMPTAVVGAFVAGVVTMGGVQMIDEASGGAGASPVAAEASPSVSSSFAEPTFQAYAARLGWVCEATGRYAAVCTARGEGGHEHVLVSLSVAQTSVTYHLSGTNWEASLRWATSQGAAARWESSLKDDPPLPNLVIRGRAAAWGDDPERVARLIENLPPAAEVNAYNRGILDRALSATYSSSS